MIVRRWSRLGYLVFPPAGFTISGWVTDARRAPVLATSIGVPMIFIGLLPPQLFFGHLAAAIGVLPTSFVTAALYQREPRRECRGAGPTRGDVR